MLIQEHAEKSSTPLNRVRVIFLGHGDAGKTSLIRVLCGEQVDDGHEPMMPGIDIREWPVPGTDLSAHFWDFGGQVMAHATHQLFLRESCLYVLVLSARSEINATEQAQYWLEQVKSLGHSAPVLMVGNKADQISVNPDMGMLKETYPNILDFFSLSCTRAHDAYQAHFEPFRAALVRQLQMLGAHQIMFTQGQFAVLARLRQMSAKDAVLSQQAFDVLCDENGVPNGGIPNDGVQNRQWLLKVLDQLGVIIHFPQLPFLDEYVLNPRWLTYGVHTLMAAQRSQLTFDDVITLLSSATLHDELGNTLSYPKNRVRLIVDVMQLFKLCYTLPDMPQTIFIPALLPTNQPGQHRKLPLGIQTFSEIISGNYYYVDKTPLIRRLLDEGKYQFLSRPRRFGKSLLLDTIKELFECNENLFQHLAIHEKWDWAVPWPVISISFNDGGIQTRRELEQRILSLLRQNAARLGVPYLEMDDPVASFGELIRRTAAQHQRAVVILVDEYDKPILDNINQPAIALEMRECLRGFYSVIKGADAHVRFSMITGVTKFSKVSLFSGLIDFTDITVNPAYSALCGYTDNDIDTTFAPELMELDREEIRHWYNGYNWLGESVYNPHGVLSLFLKRKFSPYWFESATPTFLIKLLTERETWLPSLGALKADADMLSTFDVDTIPTTALMFQAGYLTIEKEVLIGGTYYYQMRFPNREVEQSLYGSLLRSWTGEAAKGVENKVALYELLAKNDLAALKDLFQSFYSSIPHQWFVKNPIAQYEGYYASVFYTYFVAAGLQVRVEDATNLGRIDMMARLDGHIWLFEFKVVAGEAEGAALQQIKDKHYADKYRAEGLPIHMVGVEFSQASRNVVGFEVALA